MSDELQETTDREPGRRPGTPIFIALLLIALAAVIAAAVLGGKQKEIDEQVEQALKVEQMQATDENLIGNWSIKTETAGQAVYETGYIDHDILGDRVLHVLSEYDPRQLIIDINADGTLSSDELGNGVMTYKESTGKTEIRFEKEETTCTLTR